MLPLLSPIDASPGFTPVHFRSVLRVHSPYLSAISHLHKGARPPSTEAHRRDSGSASRRAFRQRPPCLASTVQRTCDGTSTVPTSVKTLKVHWGLPFSISRTGSLHLRASPTVGNVGQVHRRTFATRRCSWTLRFEPETPEPFEISGCPPASPGPAGKPLSLGPMSLVAGRSDYRLVWVLFPSLIP